MSIDPTASTEAGCPCWGDGLHRSNNGAAKERQALIEERKSLGHPPHSPPHLRQDDACYLLTATWYEHYAHMKDPARRQQVLDLLFEHRVLRGIELRAWVVMPNHYHLLA
jgi:putative transposase